MTRAWRRLLLAGVASAVLGAMVLCTMMATLAAAPGASSCHESPAEDRHDTSVAFSCCPSVVKTAMVQVAPESAAIALPPAVEHCGLVAPRPARHADYLPELPESLPLFLRHASLLL